MAQPGVLSSGILGLPSPFHPPPGEAHCPALVEQRPSEQHTGDSLGRKAEARLCVVVFLYKFSRWDCCSQERFGGVGVQRFPQERPGSHKLTSARRATCLDKAPGSQASGKLGPRPCKRWSSLQLEPLASACNQRRAPRRPLCNPRRGCG